MRAASLRRTLASAIVALSALACGRNFDPPSQVTGLRVLGVRLSSPLATPGTTERIQMLWWDGAPHARRPDGSRRPVQIAWLGGCDDPPGDLYYACWKLAKRAPAASGGPSGPRVAPDTFAVEIPPDVISRRPPRGASLPYGLSYVLYAVCGGTLVERPPTVDNAPPLACVDEAGNDLGAEDFVVGYLPIYAYAADSGIVGHNPVVRGITFAGRGDPRSCRVDGDCDPGDRCGSRGLCLPVVPHCAPGAACPGHDVKPLVDPASAEPDTVARHLDGVVQTETVYVSYFTSHGSVAHDRRKANDAVLGWTEDYGTTWAPPPTPDGETRIWAVVRDNRGGVAWWYRDVLVE